MLGYMNPDSELDIFLLQSKNGPGQGANNSFFNRINAGFNLFSEGLPPGVDGGSLEGL
jgi:hypothetical protein